MAPGQRVRAPDFTADPKPAPDLEKLKKLKGKELLDAVKAMKIVPEQVAETGTLSFPKASHPRCVPTRSLWTDMLADESTSTPLTDHLINGHHFVWVNCYRSMQVTDAEVKLLQDGFGIAKRNDLIKGFDPEDYEALVAPKPGKAFMLVCQTKAALTRLLLHRTWTVRMPQKAGTFFFAVDESWGSHIIYDIHGGGSDFVKDVLPKIFRSCGSAIAQVKAKKPRTIAFRDLAYHQVNPPAKTHKGAKGIIWRVRFAPSSDACDNAWSAPRNIGFSNRGSVEMRRPPLCSHCISYSHGQNLCQWWAEGLVAGSKVRPENQEDVEWHPVEAITWKKLGVSDEAGPDLTL